MNNKNNIINKLWGRGETLALERLIVKRLRVWGIFSIAHSKAAIIRTLNEDLRLYDMGLKPKYVDKKAKYTHLEKVSGPWRSWFFLKQYMVVKKQYKYVISTTNLCFFSE